MLIDVDSRKHLVFNRKKASPEGEEVTIQISYDKLFKHCSICGMMTHQKAYCPKMELAMRAHGERPGVFARVQQPVSKQSLLQDQKTSDRYEHSERYEAERNNIRINSPLLKRSYADGFMKDARYSRSDRGRKGPSYDNSAWRHGVNERKHTTVTSHYSSLYAPYDKKKSQT